MISKDSDCKVLVPWHSFISPKKYRGFYHFCVTRNPFSRLVSLYARGVLFRVGRTRLRYREVQNSSYKDFLKEIIKAKNESRRGWSFFLPLRRRMRQAEREMDLVLRFEDLGRSLSQLPFFNVDGLGDRNDKEDRSPSKLPWREFYQDQETVNLAIEHSWEDFEYYGYSSSLS
jgi:hypothetical protein